MQRSTESHPDHAHRQPAAAGRPCRAAERQGAGRALRQAPRSRRGCAAPSTSRAEAGRHRHRRGRRRRAQQVQLDGLRPRPARRASRDRQPGALSHRDARLDRVPRRLRRHEGHARGALRRAGRQAHRTAEARWSALGRSRYVGQDEVQADVDNLKAALPAPDARRLRDRDLAHQSRALLREPVLQIRRGVPCGAGRRDARRVPRHRRCRLRCCRSTIPAWRRTTTARRSHDRGLPQVHCAARRGAQPRAARHPGGAGPLPHLLQHQHRAARARFRAQALRRPDAAGPRGGLPDRGRQPAPRARMADLGGRQTARRQDA